MPWDEHVSRSTYVTNRAITINAVPKAVWPWLAQMGELPRGGFYSYDWIERLMGMSVASSEHILPEQQRLAQGQALDRAGTMLVRVVEPGSFLVLGPPDGLPELACTWALGLYPLDPGRTRLVSRVHARIAPTARGIGLLLVLDPGQFLMERKMLLEIKRRAEANQLAVTQLWPGGLPPSTRRALPTRRAPPPRARPSYGRCPGG